MNVHWEPMTVTHMLNVLTMQGHLAVAAIQVITETEKLVQVTIHISLPFYVSFFHNKLVL